MARLVKNRSTKRGLPPGTLKHIGRRAVDTSVVEVIEYDQSGCKEHHPATAGECGQFRDSSGVAWISVAGVHDLELVEEIGGCFGVHLLALEDAVNTAQRPKFDDYGDHVFLTLKTLRFDAAAGEVSAEHVGLAMGEGFVLSFSEGRNEALESVRERIREGKGRLREAGSDYLFYALMDAILDDYFDVLEALGEQAEALQDQVLASAGPEMLRKIHALKQEMAFLRKCTWPLRDVIGELRRGECAVIHKHLAVYLRDLHDHVAQIIDTVEIYRDMISGMIDLHLSSASNRMNEVMKTLTVVATIFIPLTFIAGVYGMNFKHMPELGWSWSYLAVWGVMAALAAGMLFYIKKKGWL